MDHESIMNKLQLIGDLQQEFDRVEAEWDRKRAWPVIGFFYGLFFWRRNLRQLSGLYAAADHLLQEVRRDIEAA
jgi:hypothetical protein